MKIDDIKKELHGYFIYRNRREYYLGFKDGADYELVTNNVKYSTLTDVVEITPMAYLLRQINNQLLDPKTYVTDLTTVIPVIDFEVFTDYDNRNNEIDKHKQLLEHIKGSKSIFGKKKDFKLIYVKEHNFLDHTNEQVGYYVIKDNAVVPIDAALIDNVDNAVEVENLQDIKKALQDDLVNQYSENYKEQCRKWDSLN